MSVIGHPITMDAFSSSNQPSPPSHVDQLEANTNGSNMQAAKISGIAPMLSSMTRHWQDADFWPRHQLMFMPSGHDNQAMSIRPQGIKLMLIPSMLMPGVFRGACVMPSLHMRPITTWAVMDVLRWQPCWTSSHQNITIKHTQVSQTLTAIININRNNIRGVMAAKNWPSLFLDTNYPPRCGQRAMLFPQWSELAKNTTTNRLERPQINCHHHLNQFNELECLLSSGRLQTTTISIASVNNIHNDTAEGAETKKIAYCPKQQN